jgi:hypothetical protein
MESFEFRFDNGSGAVYINIETHETIHIDYRFMLNNEDIDWSGHYRVKIINETIVEEFLNKGIDYSWIINQIYLALDKFNSVENNKKIKTAYQNKNIKTVFY